MLNKIVIGNSDRAEERLPNRHRAIIQSTRRANKKNKWADFLLIEKMTKDAVEPKKGSELSAGYDLYSIEEKIIMPGHRATISTHIKVGLPPNVYARIAPRSGLAFRNGIDIMAGVIDADYRGEIKVIMINTDLKTPFKVMPKMRIAQMILERYTSVDVKVVSNINELVGSTDRGIGGFGSTGV